MPSACAGGIVGQHQNARRDPRERAPGPRDDALAGRPAAGREGRASGARRLAGISAAAGAFFFAASSRRFRAARERAGAGALAPAQGGTVSSP